MESMLHIRANGTVDLIKTEKPLLDRLQQLVGGYIEIAHPRGLVPPYCLVVDDEGVLKNKPTNVLASCLYGGIIAGDAVLLAESHNADGEPDLVGLTDEQVSVIIQFLYAVEKNVAEVVKRESTPRARTSESAGG